MTFKEVNDYRRTIRDFSYKPVSKELQNKILIGALKAPSSSNTPPFKIVVAEGEVLSEIVDSLKNKLHKSLLG